MPPCATWPCVDPRKRAIWWRILVVQSDTVSVNRTSTFPPHRTSSNSSVCRYRRINATSGKPLAALRPGGRDRDRQLQMRMRSWAIGKAWQECARLQDLHAEACWIFPESALYSYQIQNDQDSRHLLSSSTASQRACEGVMRRNVAAGVVYVCSG